MAIFVNGCPAEFLLGQSLAYTTLLRPKKKKHFKHCSWHFFLRSVFKLLLRFQCSEWCETTPWTF